MTHEHSPHAAREPHGTDAAGVPHDTDTSHGTHRTDGAHHAHGTHHAHGSDSFDDSDDQVELLDLDAEVLARHIASITAWLPVERAPHRIADLGCGTGAGTFALLARFPAAEVVAVDASAAHLDRLRQKAEALGLADRVRTVRADLDADWPDLGRPELVWASASIHHMADPDRALRTVRDLLAPGGLFALVELAGLPRFLPADAPAQRPGLEERCHAVLAGQHAERVPHLGADWGPRLTGAGFAVEGERVVTIDIDGREDEAVGRYALAVLRRLRGAAADALAADDLAALDQLLDTDSATSVLRRADLAARSERTVWAARAV